MARTVNILGDTPRQQWKAAVNIYEVCIESNVRDVYERMDGLCDKRGTDECDWCGRCHSLEVALRETANFADEMRRLVEGVFE